MTSGSGDLSFWLADVFSLSPHMAILYICVLISCRSELTLLITFNLNYLFKDSILNGCILRSCGQDSEACKMKGHIQPLPGKVGLLMASGASQMTHGIE